MATITSRITAILSLNQREFRSGLQSASAAARKFGLALSAAGAAAGVKSVFSAASGRESLLRGLAATSDGLRTTSEQFKRLSAVATRNAMSVDTVALAFTQLRGAALSSGDAEKTIDAVANALNRVGKSGDLAAVMTNLVQISSRTSGLGDEIKETANYLPEVRALSKLRFGTDTGEGLNNRGITGKMFVAGLVEELAKYDRASGGAAAATARLEAAFDELQVATGSNILGTGTDGATAAAIKMEQAAAALAKKDTRSQAELEKEMAAAREADAARVAAIEAQRLLEFQKNTERELSLGRAELALAQAQAAQDDAAILSAQRELDILKDRQQIMRDLNATEAEANGYLEKRAAIQQRVANVQRDAERAKNKGRDDEDLDILEERAGGGSKRRLEKMEKKRRISAEVERQNEMGVFGKEAEDRAGWRIEAEDRVKLNEERAQKGLSPRIRSFTGDSALRRRWRRMSDSQKATYAAAAQTGAPPGGGAEIGAEDFDNMLPAMEVGARVPEKESPFQAFKRKGKGGLDAFYGDNGWIDKAWTRPGSLSDDTSRDGAVMRTPAPREERTIKGAGHREKKPKDGDAGGSSGSGGGGIGGILESILREATATNANLKALQNPSDRQKPRRSS